MKSKKILLALAFSLAIGITALAVSTHRLQDQVEDYATNVQLKGLVVATAFAQSNWSQTLDGSGPVGDMAGVFNVSADTLIRDGDWVEADTTTVTGPGRNRLGVKKLALTASSAMRCLGIAVGDIPRRGVGRVLTRGYHPGTYGAASNIGIFAPIKISRTVPGSFAVGDTTAANIGVNFGRTSASVSTGTRYKYKVWYWGRPIIAGPAL